MGTVNKAFDFTYGNKVGSIVGDSVGDSLCKRKRTIMLDQRECFMFVKI